MSHLLFFNYSIDCELPPNTPYTGGTERRPFFHGPPSWEFAQASVEGFIAQMDSLGVRAGASLFVYPDVAREQRSLYRRLAEAGVEIALHLNGLRYSQLSGDKAKWLGEMTYEEQKEAIRMAKEDLEEVIGKPCRGYRACYGSANSDTFPILEELGFTWSSNSSNRYRPEFFANWAGSWPYAHHPSRKSHLICGDLKLFEIPVTVGLHIYYDEKIHQPLDLRVETPPSIVGERRERLRAVIEQNIVEMERRNVPVRAIIGASHNTSAYNDRSTYQAQNLDWIVQHTRELAAQYGLTFAPASFERMREYGEEVGSY